MGNLQIDSEEILRDTYQAFLNNKSQAEYYDELPRRVGTISKQGYKELYHSHLVPTKIKIDVELFEYEIKRYDNYFEQWGKFHDHLPRKACALVNYDGKLKENDAINQSLYEYNIIVKL